MSRKQAQQRRLAARQRRITVLLLLAVIVLGAAARFLQLGSLPPGLYHDEAYNGLDALALNAGDAFPNFYEGWELYAADAHAERPAQETRFPLFFEGNYGREPLHIYLMALSIRLFGATPFAIRAVPAAAGVLSILTTFFACLALLGRTPWFRSESRSVVPSGRAAALPWHVVVALLAALTMAILYPAVTFSRFGLRAMLFVPFETLAVAAFWPALHAVQEEAAALHQTRLLSRLSTRWFLLTGLFLGLGVYTYAAARLLPGLFLLFIPIWLWLRPADRFAWRGVALMAGAAFLTALPLLIFFLRYPYFFIFRIGFVSNKGVATFPGRPWLTWLNNIGRVFRGLFWQGELHLRHNLPGRPYLDPVQAAFFALGVISVAGVWRQPQRLRGLFLLLWFGVMLLPTILSGDAPHFGRMTGVAAPAAILIALGAARLWQIIVSRAAHAARDGRRLAGIVIVLGFALSAGLAARDYFGRYANHPDLARDFYLEDWQLGLIAASEPGTAVLYLSPTQEEMATLYFALGGDVDRLADYNGEEGVVPAGVPGRSAVYYLRPSEAGAMQRLADYFPDGTFAAAVGDVLPFRVPADAPRTPGANPTDISFGADGAGIALVDWSAVVQEGLLYVTLYWQATGPITEGYTAFVHLLDESGALAAQLDRPPAGYPTTGWRPGEIIADQFVIPLPSDLPAGTYDLQTGFYRSDTLLPLGEPIRLGRLLLSDRQ